MGGAAPPGLRDHERTDGPFGVLALYDAVLRVSVVRLKFRPSGGNSGIHSLSQYMSLFLSV